tara:strand:+ start:1703 stop:2161 length:459 start_codon:yes stop_codon:yes gene_type:complete
MISVYKLSIGDDFYIGSSKDMKQRKESHRKAYHYEYRKDHNAPLYKKIRELGGWDKIKFEILYEGEGVKTEMEQEYMDKLKPTINTKNATTCKIRRKEQQKMVEEKRKHNPDRIEYLHKKHYCECGGSYTMPSRSKHFKTKLHTNYCLKKVD